jgi:RimJ/RimL family protein N-acetyltransferase
MDLVPIDPAAGSFDAETLQANPALAEIVRATLDLYQRRGFQPPWIGYVGREDGVYVGGCGFASPPRDGEVEIAYFTFPQHEGKGVATRMASELLRMTRPHAGPALRYVAHTLPQAGASTAILRKLGFQMVGSIQHPEDGVVWKWREAKLSEASSITAAKARSRLPDGSR